MSNYLPDQIKRHHRLTVHESFDTLREFCTEALQIPVGHICRFEPILSMNAFWVYVESGYRFSVTDQELVQWEARERVCAPGRKDFIDKG